MRAGVSQAPGMQGGSRLPSSSQRFSPQGAERKVCLGDLFCLCNKKDKHLLHVFQIIFFLWGGYMCLCTHICASLCRGQMLSTLLLTQGLSLNLQFAILALLEPASLRDLPVQYVWLHLAFSYGFWGLEPRSSCLQQELHPLSHLQPYLV